MTQHRLMVIVMIAIPALLVLLGIFMWLNNWQLSLPLLGGSADQPAATTQTVLFSLLGGFLGGIIGARMSSGSAKSVKQLKRRMDRAERKIASIERARPQQATASVEQADA